MNTIRCAEGRPVFSCKEVGYPFYESAAYPKDLAKLITGFASEVDHNSLLQVSKIWAAAVLDYKARKKYLSRLVLSFELRLLDHLRRTAVLCVDVFSRGIHIIRPTTICKETQTFSLRELHDLMVVLEDYQEVRAIEYTFCDRVIKEFHVRLKTGTPLVPDNCECSGDKVSEDKVSDLAVEYIRALMAEKLTLITPKPELKRLHTVESFIYFRFTPEVSTGLKADCSASWLHKLHSVIDFLSKDLGKKLSRVETQWHLDLKHWYWFKRGMSVP